MKKYKILILLILWGLIHNLRANTDHPPLPVGNSPDAIIHRFVLQNQSDFTRLLKDTGYIFGTGHIIYPVLLPIALVTSFSKNTTIIKIQRASILALESLILSGTTALLLKNTFHRHRPNQFHGVDQFDGINFSSTENLSFPSGHSSNAWALATSLAQSLKSPTASILLYTLASMTSYARVAANKHWVSDVTVGALIGYYSAKYISKINGGDNSIQYWPFIIPINDEKNNKISGVSLLKNWKF